MADAPHDTISSRFSHRLSLAVSLLLAVIVVSVEAIDASTLSIPEDILNGTLFVETADWITKV